MYTVDKINLLGLAISFYTNSIRKNWIMRSKAQVIEVATHLTPKVFGVHQSMFEKLSVQVEFHYRYKSVLDSSDKDLLYSWGNIKKLTHIEVLISFPSGDELSYLLPVTTQGLVNPHKK